MTSPRVKARMKRRNRRREHERKRVKAWAHSLAWDMVAAGEVEFDESRLLPPFAFSDPVEEFVEVGL